MCCVTACLCYYDYLSNFEDGQSWIALKVKSIEIRCAVIASLGGLVENSGDLNKGLVWYSNGQK